MATNLRFQVRRGTAEAWEAANSVLLGGEVALDTTHRKLKVGDGSTAWNDLPFVTPEVVNALLETNGVYDALSAYQGWLLKKDVTDINTKITNLEQNIPQIVNDGKVKVVNELKATNSGTDALSAAQGWALKQAIDGKTSVGLVNDLNTGGTDKALTAEMGKSIWDTINRHCIFFEDVLDDLTINYIQNGSYPHDEAKRLPLSANQGYELKTLIDKLQTQVDNLPSGSSGESVVIPTINVGSVSSGSTAKVNKASKSTATDVYFDFVLPKGDTGATGATPTIKVGSTTTGAAGTNASVTASTSGTTTTLKFTIPRGADGAAGTGSNITVLDSWSTSTTSALSAAKGYELYQKIKNINTLSTETWTFTLSTGSTVTKKVVLSS